MDYIGHDCVILCVGKTSFPASSSRPGAQPLLAYLNGRLQPQGKTVPNSPLLR